MQEEKEKAGRRRPGWEEYLFALIRCAPWIPEEHKKIAEDNKSNAEFLRELYLCACDGVPAEEARKAQEKEDPAQALSNKRHEFQEEQCEKGIRNELEKLADAADGLESDLRQLRKSASGIMAEMPMPEPAFHKEQDVPESGTQERTCGSENRRGYIESLILAGYDSVQLNYLLDCMESGMTPEETEKIASPKFPVEIMERLRKMEKKQACRNTARKKGEKTGKWKEYFIRRKREKKESC